MGSFYFPDTRGGESAGGSLDGIALRGFIITSVSGICTWAGVEVEMLGERPRLFLPLLLGNEQCSDCFEDKTKMNRIGRLKT